MKSNAFNWILVSLEAKTKALLTGRRREAQTKDGGPPPAKQWLGPPRQPPRRNRLPAGPVFPLVGPNCAHVNGSEFKQNQTKTRSITNKRPRSFTHVPASRRSTHEKDENGQNRSPQVRFRQNSYLQTGKTR